MLVRCCVNGQRILLEMAESDDFVESDPIDGDADRLHTRPLRNGRCELDITFVTPTAVRAPGYHRCGRLVVDWTTVHELGPLSELPSRSRLLLDRVPRTLKLEVFLMAARPPRPSELLLRAHVIALVRCDAFRGSSPSSHILNQLKDLPYYWQAIGSPRAPFASWGAFVRWHAGPATWALYEYSREELARLNISQRVRENELRLVHADHAARFRDGDVERERRFEELDAELQLAACALLAEAGGHMRQRDVMARLIDEPCFLARVTPNVFKALALYARHGYYVHLDRRGLVPIVVETPRDNWVAHPRVLTADQAEAQPARLRAVPWYDAGRPVRYGVLLPPDDERAADALSAAGAAAAFRVRRSAELAGAKVATGKLLYPYGDSSAECGPADAGDEPPPMTRQMTMLLDAIRCAAAGEQQPAPPQ
jgi:hypothetical protein